MRVYALFDRVAAARIGMLVCNRSDAPVIRDFHDALADKNGLGRHPADYELRYIGNVSDACVLVPAPHETIATGAAWVEAQTPRGPLAVNE